jgi:disulfide bond formation protein DsbB
MSARNTALIAALASLSMLLGAFAFQYFGGMAPCKLCIWQRWPHGLAFGVGLLILIWTPNRWLYLLGGLIVLFGAGVALYHAGVEQHWWQGPTTCTSGDIANLTTEELMAQIAAAPLVRCDEIPWSLFGISMAGWNGIASVFFTGLWVSAFRRG